MSTKYLGAIFFIPRQGEDLSLEKLLEKAQATEISIDSGGWVHCQWAGLIDCLAFLHERSYHQLLIIRFSQSQFLSLLPPEADLPPGEDHFVGLEVDPSLSVALTFKQACEALLPEVAFIATHIYDCEYNWVLEREWMVLAKDATALADEGFGLLYLNEEISQNWMNHPQRDDRDSLPVASGRLVFAGRGVMRWF